MTNWLAHTVPWETLDPGIVATVDLLVNDGFLTTDSGDGVSKPADERQYDDLPHVVAVVKRFELAHEAERMAKVLGDDWRVEVNYVVGERDAILVAMKMR